MILWPVGWYRKTYTILILLVSPILFPTFDIFVHKTFFLDGGGVGGGPGGIFANNGLARAHSHAHAYYP